MEDAKKRDDTHGGFDGSVGEGGAISRSVLGCGLGCGRVREADGAWGGDGTWGGTCGVREDEWAADENIV